VTCVLHHPDGTAHEFAAQHTMSAEQIEWFRAGSALNIIRQDQGG
jgi:aconitate hydratase